MGGGEPMSAKRKLVTRESEIRTPVGPIRKTQGV